MKVKGKFTKVTPELLNKIEEINRSIERILVKEWNHRDHHEDVSQNSWQLWIIVQFCASAKLKQQKVLT